MVDGVARAVEIDAGVGGDIDRVHIDRAGARHLPQRGRERQGAGVQRIVDIQIPVFVVSNDIALVPASTVPSIVSVWPLVRYEIAVRVCEAAQIRDRVGALQPCRAVRAAGERVLALMTLDAACQIEPAEVSVSVPPVVRLPSMSMLPPFVVVSERSPEPRIERAGRTRSCRRLLQRRRSPYWRRHPKL